MGTVLGRRSIATVLCSVVAATTFALATPAHADTWRHRDQVGDVRAARWDFGSQAWAWVTGAVPGIRQGDIIGVTVIHSTTSVRVAMRLRRLDDVDSWWRLRVVTPRGDTFDIQRLRFPESWPEDIKPLSVRRNGRAFTCEGITAWQTRYGLVADVPRACLNSPGKVRVGVQAMTIHWSLAEQEEHRGQDDGLWDGKLKWGVPRLSPWVAAG